MSLAARGDFWAGLAGLAQPFSPILAAWVLPPMGSSIGEFLSGSDGCLGPFLLIFRAVTEGFGVLEG